MKLFSGVATVVLLASLSSPAFGLDPALTPQNGDLQLEDLGFKPEEMTPDPALQLRLDSRSRKLKAHQITGLTTLALMTASVIVSDQVRNNDLHEILGETATATYWTTFYLAESAPKPPGIKDKGLNIKIHKMMVWIHAPLMILTPIVGLIAQNQLYSGYKHPPAGDLKDVLGLGTFISYAVGTGVMFIEF